MLKIMKPLFLILGLFPLLSIAQSEGIKFESNLSWNDIITKAKNENKHIFVDCYTTWCAPCKYMSQEVFTQKSVGDFFNNKFINVSVQMDRTPKDPMNIKEWYVAADSIGSKYGISVYPTYLILSPNGEVLDRFVGRFEESDFIARANDALIPEKQYYTLINHYKDHIKDSIFLGNALKAAMQLSDLSSAQSISEYYFASISDSFSLANLKMLMRTNISASGQIFRFFLRNATRINDILGSGKDSVVEYILCRQLIKEQVMPLFRKKDTVLVYGNVVHYFQNLYPSLATTLPPWIRECFRNEITKSVNDIIYQDSKSQPDWKAVEQQMLIHFPGYNCNLLIAGIKPIFYKSKKMWLRCEESTLAFLARYGDELTAGDINSSVWNLFMYSSRKKSLKIALKWSKRSVEISSGACEFVDTYANLLYKIGDREKALQWEKKAADRCGATNAEIRSNFEKMKNRVKTWSEI